MKKFLFVSVVCVLLFPLAHSFFAQGQGGGGQGGQGGGNNNSGSTVEEGLNGFWEIEVAGGRFVARLDQITSVSQHEYFIAEAGVKVFECTVDTDGSVTARFYFIEPITDNSPVTTGSATITRLKDIANQVTNKVGMGDMEAIVTKNYPSTTHARTSEYRLKYKETIGQIYDHCHRVWAEERGRGKGNKLRITDG